MCQIASGLEYGPMADCTTDLFNSAQRTYLHIYRLDRVVSVCVCVCVKTKTFGLNDPWRRYLTSWFI